MRKHKKISWLAELQRKLDIKFGKGLYHAGSILALVSCLSLTSCKDEKPQPTFPTQETSENSPKPNNSTSSPTKIVITHTKQTTTTNKLKEIYKDTPVVIDAYFAKKTKTEDDGKVKKETFERIKSASSKEKVCVVVDTLNIDIGTKVKIQLLDKEYKEISFGDKTTFESKIDYYDTDGDGEMLAVFDVDFNAIGKYWVDKISKDKKLQLCIKVDLDYKQDIVYCGDNTDITDDNDKNKIWLDKEGKWFEVAGARCYCLEMGLTTKHCGGNGTTATKENYKVLAKELEAEEAAVYAVSKQESSGGGFMDYDGEKVAKILYERHYMYNNLVEVKGESFANEQMNKNNYLVNSVSGKYVYNSKGEKEANENIASREKLSLSRKIDENSALKSCSWGAFQIMGQFYSRLYESPQDLEKAQDMCELQQIAYFKAYLLRERIPALKALRKKNWEEFTFYYNGKDWERNNSHYPVNMKKYYEEYKK